MGKKCKIVVICTMHLRRSDAARQTQRTELQKSLPATQSQSSRAGYMKKMPCLCMIVADSFGGIGAVFPVAAR